MISSLQNRRQEPACAPRKHRPKGLPRRSGAKAGWTPERRARQAALIRLWQPERRATGPRSDAGKARSAMNGLKHGGRSRAHVMEMRRIRYVLRLTARNIAILRTYNRMRRLESALAREAQTPRTISTIEALRGVLGRLTSTVPPRPAGIRLSGPAALSL
jgi:hypothetical protein